MAEFCLECFNKIWNRNLSENQVSLSNDFCEECGQYKPCVMKVHPHLPKTKNLYFRFSSKENNLA